MIGYSGSYLPDLREYDQVAPEAGSVAAALGMFRAEVPRYWTYKGLWRLIRN